MTQFQIAHVSIRVADAVILQAVVFLAIASFAGSLLKIFQLLRSFEDCNLAIIVLTAGALTIRGARLALLETDAVELTALSTFAVAVLYLLGDF